MDRSKDSDFVRVTSSKKRKDAKQLKGIALFAAVYQELSKSLGEDLSAAELMQAAHELIKISKRGYIDKVGVERPGRPNYYSHETDTAIDKYAWRIFESEAKALHQTDEVSDAENSLLRDRLRSLGVDYE